MGFIGACMWTIGLAVVGFAALIYDTSVVTYAGERIVNLDRQQTQLLSVVIGSVLFLAGVVLHAVSHVLPSSHDPKGDTWQEPYTEPEDRLAPSAELSADMPLPLPVDMVSQADIDRQLRDSRDFARKR